MEKNAKCHGASAEIEQQLRDVGPNHGFHASFKGVEKGERDDDKDSKAFGSAENDADDESDGGDADAFGDGAGNEKSAGGNGAHFFAEAFFDERVGGEELSAEIARK